MNFHISVVFALIKWRFPKVILFEYTVSLEYINNLLKILSNYGRIFSLGKRSPRGSIHDVFFLHVCFSLLLVSKAYQETVGHKPNSSVQTGSKSMRSKIDKNKNYNTPPLSCRGQKTLSNIDDICP